MSGNGQSCSQMGTLPTHTPCASSYLPRAMVNKPTMVSTVSRKPRVIMSGIIGASPLPTSKQLSQCKPPHTTLDHTPGLHHKEAPKAEARAAVAVRATVEAKGDHVVGVMVSSARAKAEAGATNAPLPHRPQLPRVPRYREQTVRNDMQGRLTPRTTPALYMTGAALTWPNAQAS